MSRVRSLLALLLVVPLLVPAASAEAAADVGLRFSREEGVDVVQAGCTTFSYEHNPCHQGAAMMNGLDSPKIDVLIIAPASPFAERDLRIMRQSVQMWADGLEWLARDMGIHWMADGVEFNIAVEMLDPTGNGEAHFTTYPIWDPEIVVVATNPVGGIGIGIDPIDFAGQIFGEGEGQGPCHGVQNPFDLSLWENLPGYNSHHGGRSGTYVEDCEGGGGNICFAINGAIDPMTSVIDIFQLYDLVSHEVGHCLTMGHVGDGAEGSWSSVPTNDIMAYSSDPPGISKCVSTLNVEQLAVAMSRFLDVNADGVVNGDDFIYANDAEADGDGRPFQIQHPDNHYYASPTRQAIDCPQPNLDAVPLMEVVNFTAFEAPARPEVTLLAKDQGLALRRITLTGTTSQSFAGSSVVLSVSSVPDLEGTNVTDYGVANVTATLADNGWSAALDLSLVPVGQAVVVAARWLAADGSMLDADRVTFTLEAAAPPSAVTDAQQTPAPAFALVALALLAIAVARRR